MNWVIKYDLMFMGFCPAGQTICSAALISHAVTQFGGNRTSKQINKQKKLVTLLASWHKFTKMCQKQMKKKKKKKNTLQVHIYTECSAQSKKKKKATQNLSLWAPLLWIHDNRTNWPFGFWKMPHQYSYV